MLPHLFKFGHASAGEHFTIVSSAQVSPVLNTLVPLGLRGKLRLMGLLQPHLDEGLLLVSLDIYLALKSLLVGEKIIEFFNQLSLDYLLL